MVNYIYDGNTLIAELRDDKWIYYLYGVDGIAGFRYNETTYLYRKNIQGDITHIYTEDGQQVAHYAYDAFGNTKILSDDNKKDLSSIGNINPFRYRGYYYDSETGLYYLISRYYDPETGRFISADSIEYLDPETLGGLNLYAYCNNNPVMNVDPTGKFLFTLLACAIAGAIVGAVFGGLTAAANGQNIVAGIFIGLLAGAAMGAIGAVGGAFIAPVLAGTATAFGLSAAASLAIGTVLTASLSFATGFVADIATQHFNGKKDIDLGSAAWSGLEWGVLNTLNVFLAGTAGPLNGFVLNFAISSAANLITSALGMLVDLLRNPKYGSKFNYYKINKGKMYAGQL